MSLAPEIQAFLRRAAKRQQMASLGRHWCRVLWILAWLFLAYLLLARLTGLVSDDGIWWLLLGMPLLAGGIAWFTHRRVPDTEAAAMVDRFQKNHDLFVTTVHLDDSAGAYQEQIRSMASQASSEKLALSEMIPWDWQKPLARLAGGAGILALAMTLLPQLDPFGKEETRQWLGRQQERLAELRKETEKQERARKPEEQAEQAEALQQALEQLEQTFRVATPERREEIAEKLRDHQKELGEFWKALDKEKLSEALSEEAKELQAFGQQDPALTAEGKAMRDQLREMLKEGDGAELQKTLAEMLEKAEEMKQDKMDAEERREGARDLQTQLQELADAVAREGGSPELKETLKRAIEQMQMAQNGELGQQAMKDGQRSMEQMAQQLKDLADQLEQLQQLEEALDAAQLAQQLNEMGEMNGKGQEGGQGGDFKSYAELYEKLLAEAQGGGKGEGEGREGMKGAGTGEGGEAPEDDQEVDFKTEKSPSHLVAGKTLLEWQTQGVSETGEAREAYRDSVSQLKQGLTEAIRQEKIPPGYHGQIQKYFDTLEVEPPRADDLD